MKIFAVFPLLLALGGVAVAQEQEQKLIDRLLRPNVELKSTEQNKQFYGTGSASTSKKANTKSFYVSEKPNPRTFADKREFATREHLAQSFAGTKASTQAERSAATNAAYVSPKNDSVKAARENGRQSATRDYPGNRQFNEKGKSQKSLDRKNAPMTIEQVRELLNKNK